MQLLLLPLTVVFIWGTSWRVIALQVEEASPMLAVTQRFLLAASLLFLYCWIRKLPVVFSAKTHCFVAMQGSCLFCLNYVLFYYSELYLPSGIVALVFSSIIFFNALNSFFFLKTPIEKRVLVGALSGCLGLLLLSLSELKTLAVMENESLLREKRLGFALSFLATYFASLGNVLSFRNQKQNIPILQSNAYGMLYGGILALVFTLYTERTFAIILTKTYLLSLFYLAVFASIIAFGAYLKLIGLIGTSRAAFITLLFPVVALLLSWLFEDYRWSVTGMLGVLFVLAGNATALGLKGKKSGLITPTDREK